MKNLNVNNNIHKQDQSNHKSTLRIKKNKVKDFSKDFSSFQNRSVSSLEDKNDPEFCLKQKRKYKSTQWSLQQLKKLFDLYQEYGSQWALMEKHLSNRSQNDIKNKFYGTTKNVLRGIFKIYANVPGKQLRSLNSRKICFIYQGRNQFKDYRGLIRRALQFMEFDIQKPKFKKFVQNQRTVIQKLHKSLFQKIQIIRSSLQIGSEQEGQEKNSDQIQDNRQNLRGQQTQRVPQPNYHLTFSYQYPFLPNQYPNILSHPYYPQYYQHSSNWYYFNNNFPQSRQEK